MLISLSLKSGKQYTPYRAVRTEDETEQDVNQASRYTMRREQVKMTVPSALQNKPNLWG